MSNVPPTAGGSRPATSRRPLGTASGRPPGTATRLSTAMQNPGTATGSRGGQPAISLTTQVNVVDRPMTQQGLSGMRTAPKTASQRNIQDKTFYLGQIRIKMNDLNTEIARLHKDIDNSHEENASYLTYEKRAEGLAGELRDFQAEMGDYNTLVDKLSTDEDVQDVEFDYIELKSQNEKDAKKLDQFFEIKQGREQQISQLETELSQEKRMADNLINDMTPSIRNEYLGLKDMNEHLLKQLETGQQQLDTLNTTIDTLQEELSVSQVKQEAVRLYEQLHGLETKRDTLQAEVETRSNPADEREKLLKQVKEDNQEIASMDRQVKELRDKIAQLQDEIRQLDMDIEENQGERNQKYKELKNREETMDEFLNAFEYTKANELGRTSELEQNIVLLLEHIGRSMGRFGHLPSPQELATMKQDLVFKEGEMKKSEATASGLGFENDKLQQDLLKVEQLEAKIKGELNQLKENLATAEQELVTYSDIDSLRKQGEERKKQLDADKSVLQKQRDMLKKSMQALTAKYEGLKAQLNDNETYTQLGNLERKWQHLEQNNFVMKEFIAAKTMECDFRPLTKQVFGMVHDYHQQLSEYLSGKQQYGM